MPYSDGDFQNPQPVGAPEVSYPLPKIDPRHISIKQRMCVLAQHYTGPDLDTVHYLYPKTYCTADQSLSLQGPVQFFERIYHSIPQVTRKIEMESVSFPPLGATTPADSYQLDESGGVVRQAYTGVIPRSSEISLVVPVVRHRKYIIPGKIGGYASIEDVSIELPLRIVDSAGIPLADAEQAGASPSADDYKRYAKNGYHFIVEPTVIVNYAGNIWLIQNSYTRAR